MPTLENQARAAMKAVKSHYNRGSRASSRYPLPMERDLVILYGTWRGWTIRMIADALKCSTKTVSRRRLRLLVKPKMIFMCPVLHQGLRGKKKVWRCQFCSASMLGTERKAREHVASHIVSRERIALSGVMPED